jgi:hypothetical protein
VDASPQVLAALTSKLGPKLQQLKSWELTSLLSYIHKAQAAAPLEPSPLNPSIGTSDKAGDGSDNSTGSKGSNISSSSGERGGTSSSSSVISSSGFDHEEAEGFKKAAAPLVVSKLRGLRQGYGEWGVSWKILTELAEVYCNPWTPQEVKMQVLTPLILTAEQLLARGQDRGGVGEGKGGLGKGRGGRGPEGYDRGLEEGLIGGFTHGQSEMLYRRDNSSSSRGVNDGVDGGGGIQQQQQQQSFGRNGLAPIPLSTAAGFVAALANGPACGRLLGQLADYLNIQLQQQLQDALKTGLPDSFEHHHRHHHTSSSTSSSSSLSSTQWPRKVKSASISPESQAAAAAAAVLSGVGNPNNRLRLPPLAELQQLVRAFYHSGRLAHHHPLYQTVAAAAACTMDNTQHLNMADLKSTATLLYYYSLGLKPPLRFLAAVADKFSIAVSNGAMPAADLEFAVRTQLTASAGALGPLWEQQQQQQKQHRQQQQKQQQQKQKQQQVGGAVAAVTLEGSSMGGCRGTELPASVQDLKAANASFAEEVARSMLTPHSSYAMDKLLRRSRQGQVSSSSRGRVSGGGSSSGLVDEAPFSLFDGSILCSSGDHAQQERQTGAAAAAEAGEEGEVAVAEVAIDGGLAQSLQGGLTPPPVAAAAAAEAANYLYQLSQLGLEDLELSVPLAKQVLQLAATSGTPVQSSSKQLSNTPPHSAGQTEGRARAGTVSEQGVEDMRQGALGESAMCQGDMVGGGMRGAWDAGSWGLGNLSVPVAIQVLQVLQRAIWVKLFEEVKAYRPTQGVTDGEVSALAAAADPGEEEQPGASASAATRERAVAAKIKRMLGEGKRWEGFQPVFAKWLARDPEKHAQRQLQWQQQQLQQGKHIDHIWVRAGDLELLLRASFQLVEVLGKFFNDRWEGLSDEQRHLVLRMLLEASERQEPLCDRVVRRERRFNRDRVAELGGAGVLGGQQGWEGVAAEIRVADGHVEMGGGKVVVMKEDIIFGSSGSIQEEGNQLLQEAGSEMSANKEDAGMRWHTRGEGRRGAGPDTVPAGMVMGGGLRREEEQAKKLKRLMAIM